MGVNGHMGHGVRFKSTDRTRAGQPAAGHGSITHLNYNYQLTYISTLYTLYFLLLSISPVYILMKCSFNGIIRGAKNTVRLMTFISLVLEDFISPNFMNISTVSQQCYFFRTKSRTI